MNTKNNKTMATAIVVLLVLSSAISISALTPANAAPTYPIPGHPTDGYDKATYDAIQAGMYWKGMDANASSTRLLLWTRFHDVIPTHTYMMVAPNPVGVGQMFNVVMFNPQVPPNALLGNPVRYTYTMTVVKPDGSVQNLPPAGTTTAGVGVGEGGVANGVFVSDSTGSTYTAITPDQVGNYTLTVYFQQLQYLWNSTVGGGSNDYYGTTFLASNYTYTVTVQQQAVSMIGVPAIPALPTQYWTYPIDGQNTNWYQVASNWYCNCRDRDNGGGENRYQPDGIAPNSPHILWTRPTEDNGIVGGTGVGRDSAAAGNAFNAGSQYQPRWNTQIIMHGRLYYSPNVIYQGTSELFDCVDLRTGQLIYEVNTTEATGRSATPSFGYYYSDDNPNEHGIANPGWLFSSNYAVGYQPERGVPYLHISNVPSGFEIAGASGENLRFVLSGTLGKTFTLAQWNSSRAIPSRSPTQSTIIANVPITPAQPSNTYWDGTAWAPGRPATNSGLAGNSDPCFDWNITMPWTFTTTPTVRAAKLGDILWGSNGSWPTGTGGPSYAYPNEVTIWAVSLAPNTLGQAIYMKNLQVDNAQQNSNIMFERADANSNAFVALEVPYCKFHVYNMHTGAEMFVTDAQTDDLNPYGYFTWPSLISATQTKFAYGMLYTAGYTGSVSAYDLNSTGTNVQPVWRQTAPSGGEKINNYVLMEGLIADGKIFVGTHEHSADTPLYKGERVRVFNATTGETIWTMAGWAYPMAMAVADGILVYWNNYDGQVYAVGKGPTQLTVDAPKAAIQLGSSLIISGTVMDISAGAKQAEQAANFPNGLPAVSEDSMSQWMEYVYMQKDMPNNATGVKVSLNVVDANGNYRTIGETTSDANGIYSFQWTPDIEGKYMVFASFAGSESYWPSNSETSFAVDTVSAGPTSTSNTVVAAPMTDTYVIAGVIAIIVAIAIVGAAIMMTLKKRA